MNSRLLLLSCSQRKRTDKAKLPAVERYDGPAYRLLRRYLQASDEHLDIFILSAKFGFIRYDYPIPYYDRRMTSERAKQLQPLLLRQARRYWNDLGETTSNQIFVTLGRAYQPAVSGIQEICPPTAELKMASGSSGKRLAALHDWLYEKCNLRNEYETGQSSGAAKIRGVTLDFNAEEVLQIANEQLRLNPQAAFAYQSWFVPLGEQQISPKWLVSKLTGLPVSGFHSDEARRVLAQLGVKVIRV
jgi:hypothetical protein